MPPQSVAPKREINPRIAACDKWRRIEAISRLKSFLTAYRECYLAWKEGIRDIVFPSGTYWLKHYAGAHCVPHAVA